MIVCMIIGFTIVFIIGYISGRLMTTYCDHKWEIYETSNILQQDDMGYPLRLCIMKCPKCEKYEHMWIDVSESVLDEIESGKSVLLRWNKL